MTSAREDAPEGRGDVRPHVLVVDDDPQTSPLMVAFLDHLGYTSEAVSSGPEAIEAVRTGRHGIVLIDCKMPEMDGMETTRRIRALALPGGQPKILAFSGQQGLDLRVECMAAGMDGYLPKPFTEEELRTALDRTRQSKGE
jgi:CheY-like chemotaxis protein